MTGLNMPTKVFESLRYLVLPGFVFYEKSIFGNTCLSVVYR